MQLLAQQGQELLDLARSVMRASLSGAPIVVPTPADPALHQPAGAFVSLHAQRTHKLRGCVGRLDAHTAAYQAVARAAQSVLSDPRFTNERVTLAELPSLEIEISLIAPMRPAQHPTDFDPIDRRNLSHAWGSLGCLLPQVARETGWTREQLLDRLCVEKMGLAARAWEKPEARLQKFAIQLIGPEPFEA